MPPCPGAGPRRPGLAGALYPAAGALRLDEAERLGHGPRGRIALGLRLPVNAGDGGEELVIEPPPLALAPPEEEPVGVLGGGQAANGFSTLTPS